jgi:predicted acyl esterase
MIGWAYARKVVRDEISSSNLNRFAPNPNTGEPFGTAHDPITAQQQVFHTPEYPTQNTLFIN